VVEVLKDQGCGTTITSALSKECFKIIGSIFVDDTDLAEGKVNGSSSIIDTTIISL